MTSGYRITYDGNTPGIGHLNKIESVICDNCGEQVPVNYRDHRELIMEVMVGPIRNPDRLVSHYEEFVLLHHCEIPPRSWVFPQLEPLTIEGL